MFENFIDVCMEKYGLDPSYYVTAAHLAYDAMLKVTWAEIELLTDPDMYLFFDENKRGDVSSAMKRYSEANNKYMKNYDPEKPGAFIEYLDENGLHTSILAAPLTFSGFRWLTEEEINEMMGDHTKIRSCTLRVDLEYPKELHDLHNEYPLAVESVVVDEVRKLIPNLHDKRKYVVHHEALPCYLRNGMMLKKIHEGISHEEWNFMKSSSTSTQRPGRSRKMTSKRIFTSALLLLLLLLLLLFFFFFLLLLLLLLLLLSLLLLLLLILLLLLLLLLLKLYLFTLTSSAMADFQGGRDNKKKTIYIMQIKTVKLKYDVRID